MIQNEWDSIYIHNGGAYNADSKYSYVKTAEHGWDMKANIDLQYAQLISNMKVTGSVPDSIGWDQSIGYSYTNVQAAEDKYNYTRTERSPAFKFDATVDYSKYPSFSKLDIPFSGNNGSNQVEYVYDKSTDLMTRYNFGSAFLEAETSKAVTVQNVIVQYVTESTIKDGAGHQLTDMIDSGKAEFFVGGKHMTGSWSKSDRHAGTVYKLDDGSELVLKPGNTWIAIQRNTKSVTVDSATTQASASSSAS